MLNKTVIMIAAIVFVLALGGTAMAALGSLPETSDSFKYSLSSNVSCNYDKDTAAVHYVMNCKNSAGNRIFSGSDATSKLYYREDDTAYVGFGIDDTGPKGHCMTTVGAEDTDYATNWTAL